VLGLRDLQPQGVELLLELAPGVAVVGQQPDDEVVVQLGEVGRDEVEPDLRARRGAQEALLHPDVVGRAVGQRPLGQALLGRPGLDPGVEGGQLDDRAVLPRSLDRAGLDDAGDAVRSRRPERSAPQLISLPWCWATSKSTSTFSRASRLIQASSESVQTQKWSRRIPLSLPGIALAWATTPARYSSVEDDPRSGLALNQQLGSFSGSSSGSSAQTKEKVVSSMTSPT
jgi:hypothetical protein